MIVRVANTPDKDTVVSTQSVEKYGLSSQCHERAVAEPGGLSDVSRGFGPVWVMRMGSWRRRFWFWDPVTNFETKVVWTDGREVVQQHVLRYAGEDER